MGLNPVKVQSAGGIPVFAQVNEVAQGGYTLDTTGLTADDIIAAGTPFAGNDVTRVAKISKTATIYETATASATDYKVKKGHKFIVGTKAAVSVGGKCYAVTVIDATNDSYDVLTVGTTIGALTAGDVIFEGTTEGATAGAVSNTPTGLLKNDVKVGAAEGVSLVIRGTVYERRIPGLIDTMKTALKGILFNKSY